MKLLHITPHLGGGVGKALSEICAASSADIERTFILLEEPRDRRFVDRVAETGARIVHAGSPDSITEHVPHADIVQFEFWNHPKIYEVLALTPFPAMRSVFWCHISGLFAPFIAPGLLTAASRFVFTSPCSFNSPSVGLLTASERSRLSAIGSGSGFPDTVSKPKSPASIPRVGYLGTVDFVKMHPDFFQIIDAVEAPEFEVSVWGGFDPTGDIAKAHAAMRNPKRVRLQGHCTDPKSALSDMDIFLYPLHPEHYGTAENALIEAMSLGVAPLVLANPAEVAIVKDGLTGFVAHSVEDCTRQLGKLLTDPELVYRVGAQAVEEIQVSHTPKRSAALFHALYQDMLKEVKAVPDFGSVLGTTPKDWFLSTQSPDGTAARFLTNTVASKGSVTHFLDCFPGDPGLLSLC